MPANSSASISHIEGSLRASLGGGTTQSLDAKLKASSQKILMQRLEFVPAKKEASFQLENLRAKYTPLNAGQWQHHQQHGSHKTHQQQTCVEQTKKYQGAAVKKSPGNSGDKHEPPVPAVCLFDPSMLRLQFDTQRPAGAGLKNLGNTCFFNSTLQCLCYSPAFYMALQSHRNCSVKDCMICVLLQCLRRMQMGSFKEPQAPAAILQKMRMHCKHMVIGRQEDAHECLRYLVDLMQKSALIGKGKLDEASKHTTMIAQVFGGYFRSQVQCSRCNHLSNTFDPSMDISLDVKNANSLGEALHQFIRPEVLAGDNAYTCSRCKQKVTARKHFTIHKPPNTMIIQFKRFDFGSLFGKKLSKRVSFPEAFNLRPFMSNKQGERVLYSLTGLIVHSGFSCNSGHYYSYCKAPNRKWYMFNDTFVQQVHIKRVMEAEAYLLFYTRTTNTPTAAAPSPGGPQVVNRPLNQKAPATYTPMAAKTNGNGILGKPSSESGTAVPRRITPHIIDEPITKSVPLPAQRQKVAFGIGLTGAKKEQPSSSGASTHIGSVPVKASSSPLVAKGVKKVQSPSTGSLVPYQEESSDEEDRGKPAITNGAKSLNNGSGELVLPNGRNGTPVLDSRLHTTLNVPGAYKSLDQGEPRSFSKEKAQERSESPTKIRNGAGSPVKRSLVPLSVSCPLTPTSKLNATTPWHVLDAEGQVSPSLASGSSCTSVNSTTEWQVSSNKEKLQSPVPIEASPGWTITPVRPTANPAVKGVIPSDSSAGTHSTDKLTVTKSNNTAGQSNSVTQDSTPEEPKPAEVSAPAPQQRLLFLRTAEEDKDQKHDDILTSLFPKNGESNTQEKEGLDSKSEERNGQEAEDDSSGHKHHKKSKKKKKKKHKKKHHDDREYLLSGSDDLDSSASHTPSSKKHKYSNEVSSENTKESVNDHPRKEEAPSQRWDHHVKDGHHRQKQESEDKQGRTWDGTRTNTGSVVTELMKTSSARGYGVHVKSWDGNRSNIDSEVAKDKAMERKRRWEDDYEAELDQGRTKKVKKHYKEDDYRQRPSHDAFQQAYERNREGKSWNQSGHGNWQPQRKNFSGGYQQRHNQRGSPYQHQQQWRGGGGGGGYRGHQNHGRHGGFQQNRFHGGFNRDSYKSNQSYNRQY